MSKMDKYKYYAYPNFTPPTNPMFAPPNMPYLNPSLGGVAPLTAMGPTAGPLGMTTSLTSPFALNAPVHPTM